MIATQRVKLNCLRFLLSIAATATLAGCADLDLRKNIPWGEGKDGKAEKPMQVVAFWSNAVQNRPEQGGLRGFGARLYFYGKNPNKPVKVNGSLVVYAFDETNRDPNNVVPDKKYVFTADQLKAKYSKSDLGHSYSVWLPWDAVNGQQKEITLVARFTNDNGEMVSSDSTMVRLPGLSVTAAAEPKPPKPGSLAERFAVQQASVKQEIPIPPNMAAQMPDAAQANVLNGNMPGVMQSVMTTSSATPSVTNAAAQASYGPEQGRSMKTTTIPISNSFAQQRTSRFGLLGAPADASNAQPMARQGLTAAAPQAMAIPAAPLNPSAPSAQPASSDGNSGPEAHSGFERRQAQGGLISRLESDRGQWPQRRAGQPSDPAYQQ
jgi:hypothetical protein